MQRYSLTSRQRLDIALLHFFQHFRKVYVGEVVMHASKVYERLRETVGIDDHLALLDVILRKVIHNLKVTLHPLHCHRCIVLCHLLPSRMKGSSRNKNDRLVTTVFIDVLSCVQTEIGHRIQCLGVSHSDMHDQNRRPMWVVAGVRFM